MLFSEVETKELQTLKQRSIAIQTELKQIDSRLTELEALSALSKIVNRIKSQNKLVYAFDREEAKLLMSNARVRNFITQEGLEATTVDDHVVYTYLQARTGRDGLDSADWDDSDIPADAEDLVRENNTFGRAYTGISLRGWPIPKNGPTDGWKLIYRVEKDASKHECLETWEVGSEFEMGQFGIFDVVLLGQAGSLRDIHKFADAKEVSDGD